MARSCYKDLLPLVVLVAKECINTVLHTLYKAAILKGMSHHVFVAYAHAVATTVLLPAPFFSLRSGVLPPLSILFKYALLALIGSSSQILGYAAISNSSPTLSSAISNLVPSVTFLLAIIFRMEKIAVKRRSSEAKVLGSIISIAGALVVTFYKGPSVNIIHNSPTCPPQQPISNLNSVDRRWAIGGLLLIGEYILIPIRYIVQVKILKEYPDTLTMVFFYNYYATIIGAIVGLLAETNASAWKIRQDMSLISIVCSGIFGKFLSRVCHAWALHLKGPVYVSLFRPLSIVIAVAVRVMFLGDTLHIGSLVGGTIILIGFYTVRWGKVTEEAEEAEEAEEGSLESSTLENIPLLMKKCVKK